MTWTKTPPSEPGWYWVRHELEPEPDDIEPIQISNDRGVLVAYCDTHTTWEPIQWWAAEFELCEWWDQPVRPPED